jgi:hypothetical protein
MTPTDEELLHSFYSSDDGALVQLMERYQPFLASLGYQILLHRIGSAVQASGEWDVDDRVENVRIHIHMTRQGAMATWPHQRLSALTWVIYLFCLEMDRNLGLSAPF